MGKPILAYWSFRGLTEPIRFLLHYKKVDFEDKRYTSQEEWQKDKFNLGLDFPNLPYYIDDDIKISQSNAILRHLAQKYGMDGKDERQRLRVSVAEQQVVDLRWAMGLVITRSDYNESARAEFVKKMPDMLKLWENFIGDNTFLTGEDITYVDFMAYETFDFYRLLHAEALDDFPKLKAFQNRIKSLPELQEYLNSSTYKKWPICGPTVKFGGGGDAPKHI